MELKKIDFFVDQNEIRASWEWFMEPFFGKSFVERMRKESIERVYDHETFITSNDLFRDAFINGHQIKVSDKITTGCVSYYRYILLDDQLFELVKYFGSRQVPYYKLSDIKVM